LLPLLGVDLHYKNDLLNGVIHDGRSIFDFIMEGFANILVVLVAIACFSANINK
jgi:hypothetical protein